MRIFNSRGTTVRTHPVESDFYLPLSKFVRLPTLAGPHTPTSCAFQIHSPGARSEDLDFCEHAGHPSICLTRLRTVYDLKSSSTRLHTLLRTQGTMVPSSTFGPNEFPPRVLGMAWGFLVSSWQNETKLKNGKLQAREYLTVVLQSITLC